MRREMLDNYGAVWALVAEVADTAEEELELLVVGVEDRVGARMQAMNGEAAGAHEVLRRGVSAAVRDALARLRCQTELPHELLPELLELARLCGGSRCDLAGFADAWLLGQEVFWERFEFAAERTLADTSICWDVIKAARARLRGHAARQSGLFRRACEREFARITGADDDARLRAVLRALEGEWVDPGELGYDLGSHHLAVVADASRLLDAVARRTKRQLLRVQAPDGGVWGWLGGPTRIREGDLDALIASQRSSDATVAFGEPASGIAGFAASHHQALEASAVAVATNQRAVRFADFRLLIAVLRDPDLAKGFVERELGELGHPSERMRELRETLRVYLEHSQSVASTAALRRRDRKTIERQLRTAEQLIHHHVSDRSDEVLIALRVAEILRHGDQTDAARWP
jgi:hypothetical protein